MKVSLTKHLQALGLSVSQAPSLSDWKRLVQALEIEEQTLQAQSQDETREYENQLSSVIQSVPCLVFWVSFDLRILGANKQANEFSLENRLSHYALTDIPCFRPLAQLLVPFFSNENSLEENFLLSLKRMGRTYEFKFSVRKFSNSEKAVIIGMDMTDENKQKSELEKARTTALASSRMAALGEMASGIAHEINNPLAVIAAHVQQLEVKVQEGKVEPEEFLRKLAKILSTTDRIKKIIKGLRTFARDGENDPFVSTPIKTIVEDTLELSTQRLKSQGIDLKVDKIKEDLLIECRATQIAQVLLNLISNSRDAISNLDEKWVQVSVYDAGIYIKIYVTDSGKGIPDEVADKIMNPFFTTKEVGVGTGLGLSISKGIVEAHHGKLYIDKSSSHTRFVIQLPKQQVRDQKITSAS